jgi:DNA-binding NarL/FixJ family response regulator
VLALMAQGMSNEAIARKLGISPYTAANHVHKLLEKTGAANRTEAVSLARRMGLVE